MAETVAELLVKIGADVEGLKAGSAEMRAVLGRLQADSEKARGGFSKLQATTVTLAGAVTLAKDAYKLLSGVISTVADSIKSFIDAASDQEDAQLQLRNALELTGKASEDVVSAFDAQASAMQEMSRFSDEAITAIQALLTRFGVVPESMQGATQAVADFAAATGTDLQTAAEAVGRAIEGQTRGLRAYGIVLEDTGSKSQNLANAVAAIEDRFGGAALASVTNFRGQLVVLGNAFGELQETLGGFFTQSDTARNAFALIGEAIADLNTFLQNNRAAIQAFVDQGVTLLIESTLLAAEAFVKLGRAAVTAGQITGTIGANTARAFGGALKGVDAQIDILQAKLEQITVQRAFDEQAEKARAMGLAVDAVPPKIEKIGDSYQVVAGNADQASAAHGRYAASSAATADASDKTAKALEDEGDAFKEIQEVLDGIDFDNATAGLPELEKNIAKAREEIAKLGEGKLTLEEIGTAGDEAARKIREGFSKDLFGDYSQKLKETQAESEAWALSTGRTATEQDKLARALEDSRANLDAAKNAFVEARTTTGEFSAETITARDNVSAAQSAVERAERSLASYAEQAGDAAASTGDLARQAGTVASSFDELSENIANVFKGLNAGNLNTVRTGEFDLPDARGIANTVQLAIEVANVTGNVGDLESAVKAALEAQARLVTAAQGTTSGSGFLGFFASEAARAAQAVDAARTALLRFQAQTVTGIDIPVTMSGSPKMAATDYVTRYLPGLFARLRDGVTPVDVAVNTAFSGRSGGASGVALGGGMVRVSSDAPPALLQAIERLITTTDAGAARTVAALNGERFYSQTADGIRGVLQSRGDRTSSFGRRAR